MAGADIPKDTGATLQGHVSTQNHRYLRLTKDKYWLDMQYVTSLITGFKSCFQLMPCQMRPALLRL